ncbi:MAG: hypothetical protein IT539_01380 [Bradyrhizobiaceae bacterium]|nr:hypothetical protein [Bradyrhizobiaceae bacterium]
MKKQDQRENNKNTSWRGEETTGMDGSVDATTGCSGNQPFEDSADGPAKKSAIRERDGKTKERMTAPATAEMLGRKAEY